MSSASRKKFSSLVAHWLLEDLLQIQVLECCGRPQRIVRPVRCRQRTHLFGWPYHCFNVSANIRPRMPSSSALQLGRSALQPLSCLRPVAHIVSGPGLPSNNLLKRLIMFGRYVLREKGAGRNYNLESLNIFRSRDNGTASSPWLPPRRPLSGARAARPHQCPVGLWGSLADFGIATLADGLDLFKCLERRPSPRSTSPCSVLPAMLS